MKFGITFAILAGSVSAFAGELSPAARALFRSGKDQIKLAIAEVSIDVEKATTDGLKVAVGSDELTVVMVQGGVYKNFILMKMNSAAPTSTMLLLHLQDEALKSWKANNFARAVDFQTYDAADGTRVLQLGTYEEPTLLLKHIIVAAERQARNLPGASAL